MSSGESNSDPTTKILQAARAALGQARAKLAAMSKPTKILLGTTLASAALILGWLAWRTSDHAWTTLFTNLDREDAASVVAKLKEQKVPYKIGDDGASIAVPEERARELRLELAGAGLPRGGGVGFESFDKMRLGATEFEQRVLFRRSLEGELSRTIDTIGAVQSARVHLVLPERSVFVGRSEPASASVVLKLRSGRALGQGEVAGIVHLVASSVAGLTPERVAIVSTDGTVLHKPRTGAGDDKGGLSDDEQTSQARTLESTLEERARSMLEKVVGAGHVDVRVAAELDRSRVEQVQDHYDPKTVLRSEQRTVEAVSGDNNVAGVPGAQSNLPDGAPKPAASGAPADRVTRESSTRNFEVDHVTEKRVQLAGSVRRISVAVVVDGSAGMKSPEEIERLRALVRSAVGADEKRGDVVTVDAVPFLVAEAKPEAPPSGFAIPEKYRKYAPFAGAGLAVLVMLGIVLAVRRGRKNVPVPEPLAEASPALPAASGAEAEAAPVPSELVVAPEQLREMAHARVAEDPATAALVLRFWLGAGEDRHNDHHDGTHVA